MKREINADSILDYLAAGFAGFIIKTTEAKRAEEVLFGLLDEAKRKDGGKYNVVTWDLESAPVKEKEPLWPIRNMIDLPQYSILILHNYHWFLDKPPAIQAIQNALEKFKSEGKAIIVITPFPDVPIEIRKDFMLLELPLPEEKSIRESMHHIAMSVDKKDLLDKESEPVVQAAKGLTQTEIENTLSLSVATTGEFDVKVINQQKIQTIEKSGLIEVLRTEKTFDDIRGYDQIKQVVGTMIPKPSAKGVLIVGPPGCLSGDSVININRNGKGWKLPIKDLYERVNGIRYSFPKNSGTSVRSFNGESIQLQSMVDVIYSGKKELALLELENGKSIKATPDHKIMTEFGWAKLGNLKPRVGIMCDRPRLEGMKFNFNQGVPAFSKVRSISSAGVDDTFDIQCPEHHNFVANGIVVHNCGKTEFMKCTVGQFDKIGLLINFGLLYSKFQGEGSQNVEEIIKIIEAIGSCVVIMDEFEKQFAGAASTGETDSGTARRMTGRWLQFMSEKPDGVYMMGTCNSFKGIPDEYLRVGRWDSSPFYIGLPNKSEQMDILSFYSKKLDVKIPKDAKLLPKMENWTGAEIEACCEMAVKLEVPLSDAARFIIPQNLRGFDEADELRQFAISATSEVVASKSKRAERMIDK